MERLLRCGEKTYPDKNSGNVNYIVLIRLTHAASSFIDAEADFPASTVSDGQLFLSTSND